MGGEDDMIGSPVFIGASVAGGVLATLVVAACWRWRSSFCRSSSKTTKSIQLEPVANTVVGVCMPTTSDKMGVVDPRGGSVVMGMCVDSEADVELAMDKPNQK